jgi:hypothetical protein
MTETSYSAHTHTLPEIAYSLSVSHYYFLSDYPCYSSCYNTSLLLAPAVQPWLHLAETYTLGVRKQVQKVILIITR